MVPAPVVVVTGATGLLGRAVCKEFQNSGWLVVGTGYRRARPRLLRCDLTDEDAVRGLLHEYKVLQSVARFLFTEHLPSLRAIYHSIKSLTCNTDSYHI